MPPETITAELKPTDATDAVACTPPAVVGAEISMLGKDVYPNPSPVRVSAVTVPPLEILTPELPAARSIAPVPLDWNTWEMLVSEPSAARYGALPAIDGYTEK